MKPSQCGARDAKEVRKALEEDGVANGNKGSREVQEDEDTDFTVVRSDEEVVGMT